MSPAATSLACLRFCLWLAREAANRSRQLLATTARVDSEGVRATSWAALSREDSSGHRSQPAVVQRGFWKHAGAALSDGYHVQVSERKGLGTPAAENSVPSVLPTGQTCCTCWPKWQDEQDRTQTEGALGSFTARCTRDPVTGSKQVSCLRSSRPWLHTKLCV